MAGGDELLRDGAAVSLAIGETDADVRVDRAALDLRVDADHVTEAIEERAAGVSVVDRGVGLDRLGDAPPVRRSMSRCVALTIPAVIVRSSRTGFRSRTRRRRRRPSPSRRGQADGGLTAAPSRGSRRCLSWGRRRRSKRRTSTRSRTRRGCSSSPGRRGRWSGCRRDGRRRSPSRARRPPALHGVKNVGGTVSV